MDVIKIPGINSSGKTNGCEKAGNAILKTLKEEIFSNEKNELINFNKLDLEEIHLDNSNLELTNKLIYENSYEIFETKPKVIFLGGDHSISYSTTRAFFDYCETSGKEPCLIVFDSHPNLMKVSSKFPRNTEWLRKLIEDGFSAKNLLFVGIRNSKKEELDFIKEKGIKFISMNSLFLDLENSCDAIMEFSRGKELYVSLDIEVVDLAFVSGTFFSEPGGLSSREFIYLIQRINKIKNLRAIDLVEVNPDKDSKNKTIKLASRILGELM